MASSAARGSSCSFVQVRGNFLAHIAVYEWLPLSKQHAPLLPYEILEWSTFLLPKTAEVVPLPLSEHQKLALGESPTHQKGTERVRLFHDELLAWLRHKANEVAGYRRGDREDPALTEAEYQRLISRWRAQGAGIERREWVIPSSHPDQSTGEDEQEAKREPRVGTKKWGGFSEMVSRPHPQP